MTTATVKDTAPDIGREGVYFDKRAGQYVSRSGFWLNSKGQRARALQYLGADPEQATVKHVGIVAEWKWTKAEWPRIQQVIRLGLPEAFRDTADLALPVWIKPEWWAAAKLANEGGVVDSLMAGVSIAADRIEKGKDFMRFVASPTGGNIDRLPPSARAVVAEAVAPPAHELLGFTADAERLTVEQAKARYLTDLKSRVDLPEDGIKPATYHNSERMLRLALALVVDDKPVIAPGTMLNEVSRDELVGFKRAWLRRVTAGEVSKRTAANYCKAVQYFFAWLYKRERIVSRRVADLEDVFRFEGINPINIEDYDHAKDRIKLILASASDRVKLYILLAMNCGYYQTDIGALKLSEIQTVGKDICLVRRREKTSHQNDFIACHALWPETLKLLREHLAPDDAVRNPAGLALLNEDDKPLYIGSADKARIDNITSGFWRVVHTINEGREPDDKIAFQFKQFRKLGATAMDRLGGETAQRLYRAAALEDSDKFYVRRDFSNLTVALKAWRRQLKKDGIL